MKKAAALTFLGCLGLLGGDTAAQGWERVASFPSQNQLEPAGGIRTPSDALPFWRGWTKPVYDSTNQGLVLYFANPNCCYGTFSNAVFLYRVSVNSWTLVWSHRTIEARGGPADMPEAPADNHPYHALTWDTRRHVMWKGFGSATTGGESGNCEDCGVSDLYKLDTTGGKGKWTQLCGNRMAKCPPGILQETAFAYDAAHDVIVMYGGLIHGTPTASTWEYTPAANSWSLICGEKRASCDVPPLNGEGFVYDPALEEFVLFGGSSRTGALNGDTWVYNAGTHKWHKADTRVHPPAQKFPVMDFVPKLGRVIMLGAEPGGAHTWAFDGSRWIDLRLAEGPKISAPWNENQGAYDPSADRVVLFIPRDTDHPASIWSLALPNSISTVSQASASEIALRPKLKERSPRVQQLNRLLATP